uniref:Uncharacterized protein n=1 Tax=Rhizophora mucronata TaxID=61149 RepID=A0A2P2P001_RHIMU
MAVVVYLEETEETRKRLVKNREKARRRRGLAPRMYKLVWRSSLWMVSTNRFRDRIGGMYSVKGTAEKATAKNSCSICLGCFAFP